MSMLQVPRHLRRPGDDGYRTPTIEDTELFCQDSPCLHPIQSLSEAHATALSALNDVELRRGSRTNDVDEVEGLNNEKSVDDKSQKLGWKQRIRHLTWTYFTLTMATGGIANVLYNSKSLMKLVWPSKGRERYLKK